MPFTWPINNKVLKYYCWLPSTCILHHLASSVDICTGSCIRLKRESQALRRAKCGCSPLISVPWLRDVRCLVCFFLLRLTTLRTAQINRLQYLLSTQLQVRHLFVYLISNLKLMSFGWLSQVGNWVYFLDIFPYSPSREKLS